MERAACAEMIWTDSVRMEDERLNIVTLLLCPTLMQESSCALSFIPFSGKLEFPACFFISN